ncbi:MAG: FHA domain-containing protein, partial [Pseudonocardiales bacterium]
MRIDITVRDEHGVPRDVAVCAPDGSTVHDIAPALCTAMAAEPGTQLWLGARRLGPDVPLGGHGLRCGDVVSADGPDRADPAGAAVHRLQVVGGPDGGRAVALPRGIVTIGRTADCDLVLTDPDVSRRHASITVTSVGMIARDLSSTNGTTVEGRPVDDDGTPLAAGAMLRVGDSFVSICTSGDPPAAV